MTCQTPNLIHDLDALPFRQLRFAISDKKSNGVEFWGAFTHEHNPCWLVSGIQPSLIPQHQVQKTIARAIDQLSANGTKDFEVTSHYGPAFSDTRWGVSQIPEPRGLWTAKINSDLKHTGKNPREVIFKIWNESLGKLHRYREAANLPYQPTPADK